MPTSNDDGTPIAMLDRVASLLPKAAAAEVTVRSDDGDVVVERVGPGRGQG
ncbi:hypothetical protein [Mycolicibacterium porcinum]|uniref:hypothetical protein n=1 Tax=Mycolicibacterium porcinum TaxID=39693 RepID=UPI0013F4D2DE|nr:hypothetical protein [Mycolicibacterium porcinum]